MIDLDDQTPVVVAGTVLDLGVGEIRDVEPIKHGLTNRSWLVRTSADRLVVRISDVAAKHLQIDRSSEAVVLEVVAKAGIGPQVLRCNPARGILVTRYLGETWTEQDAQCEDSIGRLAGVLRRLHALDVPGEIRTVDLASTVHGYLHTLQHRGTHRGLTLPALRECADKAAMQLSKGSTPRLCHNDVHHLNVIDGEPLRLIDWEYAGIGEPLFDLASVCVYHRYRKQQREQLLAAYGVASDCVSWQRLELACWLFDYIRDLWMAVR